MFLGCHRIFVFFLRRGIPSLLLFTAPLYPLELQYIPVLPSIITNASLDKIDLFGEGFGSPIFILFLNNAGDTATYKKLRIRYSAELTFAENGTERSQLLYEGLTDEFSVYPNETVKISSVDFLKGNNPSVRTSLRYLEYELDDPELKDRLLSSQNIPDGTLKFSLQLFPGNLDPVSDDNYGTHEILNAKTIDLITPGNELGQPPEELSNLRPLFTWISQLYPGIYNTDDVFEIQIHEARPGVSSSEALARPPLVSRRVNAYTFQYPADVRPLVPGYTYYWRVVGFLKGTFTSEVRSNVFGFKITPLTDSSAVFSPRKLDEVLEILRPIIGEDMVEELQEYVSGSISIDAGNISKEQLADLVRQIIVGDYQADEPSLQ